MPFRGFKCGEGWAARTVEPRPFTGLMAVKPVEWWRTLGFGGGLESRHLWILFDKGGCLVGVSRDPDLGHPDRVVDSFISAASFPLRGAKELKSLADAYKANQDRQIWMRSDEPESLSWAADKAFVEAGLKLHLYAPIRNIAFCGPQEKNGTELWERWSKRIQGMGGTVVAIPVPSW